MNTADTSNTGDSASTLTIAPMRRRHLPEVLAIEALHLRKAAIYFAVLLIWRMALVMAEGQPAAEYAGSLAALTSLAVLALCILAGMAWLISRTSLYTLTDRRVVMRIGVVLGITFNLPLGRIVGADIRLRAAHLAVRQRFEKVVLACRPGDLVVPVHE